MNTDNKIRKALFFGDSNTFGYDPACIMGGRYPREQRWTTILQKNLTDTWQIESDGLPGRAIPVTKYEWEYLRSLVQQAMPLDLFAVMLGTNDLLSTLRPSAAKTAGMMNEVLTFVKAVVGNRQDDFQILLIAPPAIRLVDQSYAESYVSGDRTYAEIYAEEGRKLSQYYRELAKYRNVKFADASEWPLSFAYDGVHLSEEGHAVFAEYMTQVLRNEILDEASGTEQ